MSTTPDVETPSQIYGDILNSMQDAVLSFSLLERRLIYGSPSVETVLGRPLPAFIDDPTLFQQIVHPDDLEAMLAAWEKTLRDGLAELDYRLIWPDGQIRWVHHRAWISRDENGHPLRMSALIRDITEHKQTEAALRASEARYRSVVESTDSSIVMLDEAGHILFINSVGKGAVKAPDDLYIGRTLHDFFPSEVADARLKVVQAVIRTGSGQILEETRVLGTEQHWYRISVQPVRDTSAAPTMALINVNDITPLKQAEAALRHSNTLFSSFMEHLSAGTFIQNHEGRIQYCNSLNARSFHLTPDEIVGRLPEDYTTPEQAQLIRDENRQLLESGQDSLEFAYQGERNGRYHFWRILKFLIPQEHGLSLIGGISINVTKEKQAESALQTLNDQLEQRVAERTAELERAKDRIEAIFNHSGDGIVLLDVNCAILQANFAFETLFGVHSGYVDTSFARYFHADCVNRIEGAIHGIAASHETRHIEACARGIDGSYFDVEISFAPVNRSDKQVSNLVGIIRDVRQRKQAEQALRRSEERLSMMLSGTRAGTWEWFVQTGETIFNERWAEIVGYTLEELAPISIETWTRLTHPDDLKTSSQFLEQHFSGTTTYYDCEARMRHKDGHWVWVWDRGMVMEWTPDGKPRRMLGTHVDITAIKSAQQSIAEERNLLRAIIDAVPNYIYVKDREHRLSLCNLAYAHFHGYADPAELIGKTDADIFLPQDSARFWDQDQQILDSGISLSDLESEYLLVGDKHTWTLTNKVPLRNLEGAVTGVLGVTHDVTAIKAHEVALRASETRYRTTISALSEGIIMQDADGVIQVCNAAATTILGWPIDEMHGRTSLDPRWQAVHEDGTPFPGEMHPAMVTLRTGVPQSNVIMGVRKLSGELAWISINSQAVINPGETRPSAVVTTFDDITAQRLVEAEIRQKRHEERRMQGYLKALHNATIRLTRAENLDAFYRTVVEEALAHFDYERVGLLLFDSRDGSATGTYGTDEHGQLVDEYHVHLDPASLTGILKRTLDREERFAFDEHAELFANRKLIGVGHNAVAALWNGEALGWLAVDNAIHHRPITKAQLDILALYALTVGALLARKRAEFALRDSEQRYRLLAENIKDVIIKQALDTTFTFVSPSSYALAGYQPEELLGRSGLLLVHPDDQQPSMRTASEATRSGATFFTIEERILHKQGRIIWVEIAYTVVRDPITGEACEFIGILHDITERKAAEEALRESEARYQSVVETQSDLICRYQPDLTLSFVNKAYCRYFDRTPEELLGRSFLELIPEEEHAAVVAANAELVRTHSTSTVEHQVFRADGVIRWQVWTNQVVVNEHNEVVSIQSVGSDITERKQAEAALKQALAQEKELGELKTRFVSMASHEFRTPLAAILATVETLTIYRDRMDSAQLDARLDKIRHQVSYMKGIMDDVLQLARIQAGRVEFKPERGDIQRLFREVIEEFDSQLPYQNRICYAAPEAPVSAVFDERLMRQIISNLISNALKYSPAEKSVDVRLTQDAHEVTFSVQDAGIGIPPDDLKHLFEPFHRAANVGTISGTGLGLSITKQAVDLHHGSITPDSQVNVGTTFTVVFPKEAAGDVPTAAANDAD